MGQLIIITDSDEKRAEMECYKSLDMVKSYLEWIPNNDFKNNYSLNLAGEKRYPQLIGQVFFLEEIEKFIFQMGSQVNPLIL